MKYVPAARPLRDTCSKSCVVEIDWEILLKPDPVHNSIGIGTITDEVSATHRVVISAACIFQNGLERVPVGVNVAEDQIAHSLINETSGGAPKRTGTPIVPIPEET